MGKSKEYSFPKEWLNYYKGKDTNKAKLSFVDFCTKLYNINGEIIEDYIDNKDFIRVNENVNAEFTQEEMREMTSQKRSALGITTEYNISLDMAKHLSMLENNVIGQEVRSYFIIMEKTLRDYEKWTSTREPEKQEYNLMVDELKNWCERKGYELDKKLFSAFRIKESNMINENLTGKIAREIS